MALSMVVLPEPVPPEISTFSRAATTAFSTVGDLRRNAADLDQPVHADRHLGEFADRQQRSVERERRDDRVDAAAVGQPRIDRRRRFIDPPADRGDDLLDDPQQMLFVLEPHRARLERAVALDEHLVVAVDQDVGDRGVLEQRLERPEAEQFVEHVADQLLALGMVERMLLLGQLFLDDVADLVLDLLARHGVERGQVDEIEQAAGEARPSDRYGRRAWRRRRRRRRSSAAVPPGCARPCRRRPARRPGWACGSATWSSAPARARPRRRHRSAPKSRLSALLRLISSIGTPRSIAAHIVA